MSRSEGPREPREDRAGVWWCVVSLAVFVGGCFGGHRVDLEFHTPAACSGERGAGGVPDGGVDTCPLGAVSSIRTRIDSVDGTAVHSACQPLPDGFCRLRDLRDFLLVPRITAADGLDIRITGWTDSECTDLLVLECESFGDGAVDLGSVDVAPLFCACPYPTDR